MGKKTYYETTPRLPDDPGLENLKDTEAEGYLLTCLMQEDFMEEILNDLTPGDFSEPINGHIFRHIGQIRAAGGLTYNLPALQEALADDPAALADFNEYGKRYRKGWNIRGYLSEILSRQIGAGSLALDKIARVKELKAERITRQAAYKLANAHAPGSNSRGVIAEVIDSLQGQLAGDTGGNLFKPETAESIGAEIGATPQGIGTGYYLTTAEGGKVEFIIPPGAVTLICGLPGHCKSVLLRNLALRLAESLPHDILYFSYEESKAKTETRLLSAYIGEELQQPGKEDRGSNTRAIEDYFRTGKANYIKGSARANFEAKKEEYMQLRTSGKLRVYSPEYTASELVAAVNAYRAKRPVSAVVLDYIQYLKSSRNIARVEELRDIAQNLLNLAKTSGIPVIAAAQYNRSVSGPWALSGGTIAESQDLTRYADTILGLWNGAKKDDINTEKAPKEANTKFSKFITGTPGELYAVLHKSRETEPGAAAFWKFNGKIGLVGERVHEAMDLPEEDNRQYNF